MWEKRKKKRDRGIEREIERGEEKKSRREIE